MMERTEDANLAGWHRDPSGRHELRFWDGDAWTEHVIDEGIPGLDFPTRSGRAPQRKTTAAPPPPVDAPAPDSAPETSGPPVIHAADPSEDSSTDAPSIEVAAVAPEPQVALEPEIDPVAEVEPEPEVDVVAEVEPEPEVDVVAAVAPEPEIDLVAAVAPEPEPQVAPELDTTPETIDLTAAEADEPVAAETPLVPAASVLTPSRDGGAGADHAPAPTMPVGSGAGPPRTGGRSLRAHRHANPAPAPPAAADSAANAPAAAPPGDDTARPDPGTQAIAAESEPVGANPPATTGAEPEPAPARVGEVEETPEPVVPIEPTRNVAPIRLVADAPTVASPAGNSAGSNTSAIADPHRHTIAAHREAASGPRVAGISPVPVKRYRPGSPPASPLAGPRALPAPTGPVGTVVAPWYRKASSWLTIVGVSAVAALVLVLTGVVSVDDGPKRLGGRPPAAAPEGHKVIDGDGFGIAAPSGWIVGTDPGNTFPQLRRTNWGTPLVATDTQTIAGEALIVVRLDHLAHAPQVDPDLFWSDQIKDVGPNRSLTPGPPLSVHGFRANKIAVNDTSGKALVAASIDTGDRTFLVAVTATAPEAAQTEFDRLIQTFDAR